MEPLGAPVVAALELRHLGFRFAHVQRELLHARGEPLDQPRIEVERVEIAQELLFGQAHLVEMRPALLLGGAGGRLLLQLHELPVELPDPFHRLEGAGPLALGRVLGVPVAEVDLEEILDPHLPLAGDAEAEVVGEGS